MWRNSTQLNVAYGNWVYESVGLNTSQVLKFGSDQVQTFMEPFWNYSNCILILNSELTEDMFINSIELYTQNVGFIYIRVELLKIFKVFKLVLVIFS